MEPQKLKRVIIKEELVELTGSYVDAILLNQLLYWSERVKDFDLFLQQEAELNGREPDKCYFGWIYKSYDALSKETMLGLSPSNIKKHIETLHNAGFIEIRQNKNKWDRRKEYKINLKYIQNELILKGYSLEGYTLDTPFSVLENGSSEIENGGSKTENRTNQNRKTVTEITTETTTDIKKKARKETKANYDEILATIENAKLKNAFYDFIKMRMLIKSPLTNRALTMLIDKVIALSPDEDTQIKILEQSILNNWKSVYPLKGDYNKNNDIDSDSSFDETEKMLNERRKKRGQANG
ncbi:MAG: hypothetical protein V8S74_06110 [Lachnospirales bacterium]